MYTPEMPQFEGVLNDSLEDWFLLYCCTFAMLGRCNYKLRWEKALSSRETSSYLSFELLQQLSCSHLCQNDTFTLLHQRFITVLNQLSNTHKVVLYTKGKIDIFYHLTWCGSLTDPLPTTGTIPLFPVLILDFTFLSMKQTNFHCYSCGCCNHYPNTRLQGYLLHKCCKWWRLWSAFNYICILLGLIILLFLAFTCIMTKLMTIITLSIALIVPLTQVVLLALSEARMRVACSLMVVSSSQAISSSTTTSRVPQPLSLELHPKLCFPLPLPLALAWALKACSWE